ncbi:MAG: alpha/beta hydrolase, partial [Lachnospiraceae bacterium]|nr:alpha/beta hydrolase [Lachnospiraceae bacterium]
WWKLKNAGLTQYEPPASGYDPSKTTFPMAASSHSASETERYVYVAGNDIASAGGAADPDGNVDVYDVEAYSWDVYTRALEKYGANNLVLLGASSGGGVCMGLCVKAAMQGKPQPANTILFCPWTDVKVSDEAKNVKNTGGVDFDSLRYWGARYTRATDATYRNGKIETDYDECVGAGTTYYFASPLRDDTARNQLGNLKNIAIYAGSKDPCYPDAEKFYNEIKLRNGTAEWKLYNGQHAFMLLSSTGTATEVVHDACWKVMTQ